MPVLKWTSLALGAAGLAVGITFSRLAAGRAKALEDAARNDLPEACLTNPAASGCGGNPEMNTPVVGFNARHYDLQQSYKTNNALAAVAIVSGGALIATSVVLFVVDHRKKKAERRERSSTARLFRTLQVAPVLGADSFGLVGEVGF